MMLGIFGATARLPLLGAVVTAIALAGCGDLDDDARRRRSAATPPSVLEQERSRQGIDLRGVGYDLGDPRAPIAVVEFSDFGCRFCGQFARETFPTLREEFIETGKVRWKYVPFVLGIFPNGDRAAIAGECAAQQGEDAFWAMHDLLYERQGEWRSEGGAARSIFAGYAAEVGIDGKAFSECYDANQTAPTVARNDRLGRELGVRATPTFFINGVRVEGALPLELFRRVFDEIGQVGQGTGGR